MYSPSGRQTKGLSSSGRDEPRNVAILQQLTGTTLKYPSSFGLP
jgi:hypothetical protein